MTSLAINFALLAIEHVVKTIMVNLSHSNYAIIITITVSCIITGVLQRLHPHSLSNGYERLFKDGVESYSIYTWYLQLPVHATKHRCNTHSDFHHSKAGIDR